MKLHVKFCKTVRKSKNFVASECCDFLQPVTVYQTSLHIFVKFFWILSKITKNIWKNITFGITILQNFTSN